MKLMRSGQVRDHEDMAQPTDFPEHRLQDYLDLLAPALGHHDPHALLRAYLTGLCLPGERKSVEPMAPRVDPRHVRERHQSLPVTISSAGAQGMPPRLGTMCATGHSCLL